MSGIEPFQFEPVYQPGEEPPQEESVGQEPTKKTILRGWETPNGVCAALVRLCRWQMNVTAAKN